MHFIDILLICRQYTTKVFVCGDYEFLSKMYGISGASGMRSGLNTNLTDVKS